MSSLTGVRVIPIVGDLGSSESRPHPFVAAFGVSEGAETYIKGAQNTDLFISLNVTATTI